MTTETAETILKIVFLLAGVYGTVSSLKILFNIGGAANEEAAQNRREGGSRWIHGNTWLIAPTSKRGVRIVAVFTTLFGAGLIALMLWALT